MSGLIDRRTVATGGECPEPVELTPDQSPETTISTGMELTGPVRGEGAAVLPSPSLDRARGYISQSEASSTVRGYRADWRDFSAWCALNGVPPLPASPESVVSYIAQCAQRLKPGSLDRRLNALSEAHKALGLESPTHASIVRNLMKGIRRVHGTAPIQKTPALIADIRVMVDATDAGLIGLRDRALLLLGFAGAFRRSELVGLDIADCIFNRDGLTINLRRSKTDQEGVGRKIGIPYGSNPDTCPVRNLQTWIEQATITSGPLFRAVNRHNQSNNRRLSGGDVARIVKKLASQLSG